MQAFWQGGYNATSTAILSEKTRLNPGSLYNAFHSKEALFLEVIDHYAQGRIARLEALFDSASSPLSGLRQLFQLLAREVSQRGSGNTCLLINTVLEMSRHHAPVQDRVNGHLATVEALIKKMLQRAQDQGELGPDKDAGALAAYLICSIWGLRVLAGTAPSLKKASAIVSQILLNLD